MEKLSCRFHWWNESRPALGQQWSDSLISQWCSRTTPWDSRYSRRDTRSLCKGSSENALSLSLKTVRFDLSNYQELVIGQLKNQWKPRSKCHKPLKFDHIAHDNRSKSKKNSDQVSCPASTGKEKWMKLTGPVTFFHINKYSKTEILAFCYWHNYSMIGLRDHSVLLPLLIVPQIPLKHIQT